MPDTRVGISGWRYAPWRGGRFYPAGLPQHRELWYASRRLNSIEINGSFYSLQRPSSYRQWHDETPDDFVFSVKGGRFITHLRRLKDVDGALANFFASGLLLLKEKLGPILWQFPPQMKFDHDRFARFFELLPRDTFAAAKLARKHDAQMRADRVWTEADARRPLRYAVEFRHESFVTDAFVELMRRHGIALVLADTARRFPYVEDMTADFVYARLHGDEQIYVSGYTDDALDAWAAKLKVWRAGGEPKDAHRVASVKAKRVAGGRDVYVYFDNDVKVHAPYDAMHLAERLGVALPPEPELDLKKRRATRKAKVERPRTSWPTTRRTPRVTPPSS